MDEAERLENMWRGTFGYSYTIRNKGNDIRRSKFWWDFVHKHKPEKVLEVGCGSGKNLYELVNVYPKYTQNFNVYGIDVNPQALTEYGCWNVLYGKARDIPFKDGFFDLVFTCGVLIHQPEESLLKVMGEIVRCSRKYVLCMEYHADKRTEVPYRDQTGALFKGDYARIYRESFGLKEVEGGFLTKEEGFDDLTWSLMVKA